MTGDVSKERVAESVPPSEGNKERLYGEIILEEARSLLAKYLPIAFPQEPTVLVFGDIGSQQHIGKFKGKHYINAGNFLSTRAKRERYDKMLKEPIEVRNKKFRKYTETSRKEIEEWFRLIDEGVSPEEANRVFTTQPPYPEPESEKLDWEEPERLLSGSDQYSIDTWERVYPLVHELIHQRQAELNPQAFPELSSPELDNIDPESIPRNELKSKLREAHRAHAKTVDENSLLIPVIEGMAVVGTFYVMGRFLADLRESGKIKTAEMVRKVRDEKIRSELRGKDRDETHVLTPYEQSYGDGARMIKKLYKQFGIENALRMLTSVDLHACQGIIKGSAEYQQIVENPALLPGLQKIA